MNFSFIIERLICLTLIHVVCSCQSESISLCRCGQRTSRCGKTESSYLHFAGCCWYKAIRFEHFTGYTQCISRYGEKNESLSLRAIYVHLIGVNHNKNVVFRIWRTFREQNSHEINMLMFYTYTCVIYRVIYFCIK